MSSLPCQVLSREHLVGSANRCASGAAPGNGHPNTTNASVSADTRIPFSDNLSHAAIPYSNDGSTNFGSSVTAALAPLLRVPTNVYNPDPTRPSPPSPSNLDLLHMLTRKFPPSQLIEPQPPADHPPAIFVFDAQHALTPSDMQLGSTSSARRRARVCRTAYRMAAKLNLVQPPDDWSPDTSAAALDPRLKRVRHAPPASAWTAPRDDRQWLQPSAPNRRDSPPANDGTSSNVPCCFRPSTPPHSPPDPRLANAHIIPEEHRWPSPSMPSWPLPSASTADGAARPNMLPELRPPSPPGSSPAAPHGDTPTWSDARPFSPSRPPPDSPPVDVRVPREVFSTTILPAWLRRPGGHVHLARLPPFIAVLDPDGSPTSVCSSTPRGTPPALPRLTVQDTAAPPAPGRCRPHRWPVYWTASTAQNLATGSVHTIRYFWRLSTVISPVITPYWRL
jgi:hypothetical protein